MATLLERANKQIYKVEQKKIFYLTVLFCCNVGASDLVLKPVGLPEGGGGLFIYHYLYLVNNNNDKYSKWTTSYTLVEDPTLDQEVVRG